MTAWIWVAILRASIFSASQIATYDHTKYMLKNNLSLKDGIQLNFSSAMIAGLVTTTVSTPADFIKSVMMNNLSSGKDIRNKQSVMSIFKSVIQRDYGRTFFRGWFANYIRLGPHTVITMLSLEKLRNLVGWETLWNFSISDVWSCEGLRTAIIKRTDYDCICSIEGASDIPSPDWCGPFQLIWCLSVANMIVLLTHRHFRTILIINWMYIRDARKVNKILKATGQFLRVSTYTIFRDSFAYLKALRPGMNKLPTSATFLTSSRILHVSYSIAIAVSCSSSFVSLHSSASIYSDDISIPGLSIFLFWIFILRFFMDLLVMDSDSSKYSHFNVSADSLLKISDSSHPSVSYSSSQRLAVRMNTTLARS